MSVSGSSSVNRKIKAGSITVLAAAFCVAAATVCDLDFLSLVLPNGKMMSPVAGVLYFLAAVWFLRTSVAVFPDTRFTRVLCGLFLFAAMAGIGGLLFFPGLSFFTLTLPECIGFFIFGLTFLSFFKPRFLSAYAASVLLFLLSLLAAVGLITCILQTIGTQTYFFGRTAFVSYLCMRLITHLLGFYLPQDRSVLLYNRDSEGGRLVNKLAPFIVLATTSAGMVLLYVIENELVTANFAILCFTLTGVLSSLLYALSIGADTDNTAGKRKILEENLAKSERDLKYFEQALNAGAMVTMADANFRYTYVNDAFCERTGFSQAELLGEEILTLKYSRKPEKLKNYFKTVLSKKSVFKTEAKIWLKEGGFRHVDLTVVPFLQEPHRIESTLNVYFDIHDQKLREEELAARYKTLEIKNKDTEQFAYLVSHDLQEPLRTITNFADILKEENSDNLSPDGRASLTYIQNAAERMSRSVKGLLDYSRLGREKETTTIDCNETVEAVRLDLHEYIKKQKAVIDTEYLPVIEGYDTEFRLLFQNLIHNGIKFSRKDVQPVVRITTEDYADYHHFTVRDNGVGIKSEYLDKVFTIFQRAHQTSEYEGTGIGLTHCSKIVEMHGGRIWVESKPGEGSAFHFTIPKVRGER